MSDVPVTNVPDEIVESLKDRAERNGRSLDDELREVLGDAALGARRRAAIAAAAAFRRELMATGRTFSDSTDLVREERD